MKITIDLEDFFMNEESNLEESLKTYVKDNVLREIKEHIKEKVDTQITMRVKEEVEKLGYVGTGKKYGVSDNGIRRWVKTYEKYNF